MLEKVSIKIKIKKVKIKIKKKKKEQTRSKALKERKLSRKPEIWRRAVKRAKREEAGSMMNQRGRKGQRPPNLKI